MIITGNNWFCQDNLSNSEYLFCHRCYILWNKNEVGVVALKQTYSIDVTVLYIIYKTRILLWEKFISGKIKITSAELKFS